MVAGFAVFLVAHGLIHLLGVAKAFGLASLPQLRPIAPAVGLLWLAAAALFLLAAVSLFVWPRWWWVVGACAVAVSMLAIAPSWTDARFGALANLVAIVGVGFGFLACGPGSLRAEYDRDVDRALASDGPSEPIVEADLAHLPAPVQQYLRRSGVVGQPRIRNFRVRMHGRIRNGPDARWMELNAEQYNTVDEPVRLFYMTASIFMIPAQGYHRFVGPSATMRVKAAAIVPVLDVSGPEMNQGETVTMFNDMCMMAPGTLISPAITWQPVDDRTARARFTNAGQVIGAELVFNEEGDLVDFRSDDRFQTSPDGKTVRKARWSTPLAAYRSFGPVRLASGGEAWWHEPGGSYAYIELTFDDVQYNVRSR
jgi:hypothetical protein